jgi:hypothetical protein
MQEFSLGIEQNLQGELLYSIERSYGGLVKTDTSSDIKITWKNIAQ